MIFWVKSVKIILEIFVFVLSIGCRVISNIISHKELVINNIVIRECNFRLYAIVINNV